MYLSGELSYLTWYWNPWMIKYWNCSEYSCCTPVYFLLFLEDLYCLSWISLNSIVRQQLVNRKPEPPLLPTQGILKPPRPYHIDMVLQQVTGDDAVTYTQQWRSKLAEVVVWGIEPPTFRLGVQLRQKWDTLTTLPLHPYHGGDCYVCHNNPPLILKD